MPHNSTAVRRSFNMALGSHPRDLGSPVRWAALALGYAALGTAVALATAEHGTTCVDRSVDLVTDPPRLHETGGFDIVLYYTYALVLRALGLAVLVLVPRLHPVFALSDVGAEVLTSMVLLHLGGIAGLRDKILTAALCCAAAIHAPPPRSRHWVRVVLSEAGPSACVWVVTLAGLAGFDGLGEFPRLSAVQVSLTVGLACDMVGVTSSVAQHVKVTEKEREELDTAYDYTVLALRAVLAVGLVHACDAN